LGEPDVEAGVWHQLAMVAQREQNWPEAERSSRESLLLREQLGDRVGAAQTCSQLGDIAQSTQRFVEAKGWFQRAVQLAQEVDPTSRDYADHVFNFGKYLVMEVRAGVVQNVSLQLEEARRYLEQALAIQQALRSPDLWKTFGILADIAETQ